MTDLWNSLAAKVGGFVAGAAVMILIPLEFSPLFVLSVSDSSNGILNSDAPMHLDDTYKQTHTNTFLPPKLMRQKKLSLLECTFPLYRKAMSGTTE